jgi:hypothetical protein
MPDFGLIGPFLTDNHEFKLGAEFGMMYMRLLHKKQNKHRDLVHAENEDKVRLMAQRIGWEVTNVGVVDKTWKRLTFRRREQ